MHAGGRPDDGEPRACIGLGGISTLGTVLTAQLARACRTLTASIHA
jgi:hypothetical protein